MLIFFPVLQRLIKHLSLIQCLLWGWYRPNFSQCYKGWYFKSCTLHAANAKPKGLGLTLEHSMHYWTYGVKTHNVIFLKEICQKVKHPFKVSCGSNQHCVCIYHYILLSCCFYPPVKVKQQELSKVEQGNHSLNFSISLVCHC